MVGVEGEHSRPFVPGEARGEQIRAARALLPEPW